MSDEYQVVLCTVADTGAAETIATALVTEQLAACVNIVPGVTSIYRWQDKVQKDTECLLMIKTAGRAWDALAARIRALHPYELPEIIAVSLDSGQQEYLEWLNDSVTVNP